MNAIQAIEHGLIHCGIFRFTAQQKTHFGPPYFDTPATEFWLIVPALKIEAAGNLVEIWRELPKNVRKTAVSFKKSNRSNKVNPVFK